MHETSIIFTLFLIFSAAAITATLMLWSRQALIIGFILAGIVIGPWGTGWIADTRLIADMAEAGIIFLLFLLGLDLTPQKLMELFKQTTLVTLMTSIVFLLLGYVIALLFGFDQLESLLVGVAAMFSSTIISIKLLPTTVLHHRHTGEVIISVLLLQDMIAIFVMVILQGLDQASVSPLSFLKPALAVPGLILIAYLVERFILLPLFKRFDRVQEYIFLLTLAWALGMAELGHVLGLSYEIGAFVGGVILATSPIAQFIVERLKPLRDFFLVLFFFALGAGLNLDVVPSVLLSAAVLAVVMLALKPIVFRYAFGQVSESPKLAWETGWRLGQMSEFSLLITFMATGLPGISDTVIMFIQVATILTFIGSSSIVVLNYPTPVAMSEKLRRD